MGCSPDKLRAWLRQHERNNGAGDGGLTSDERQRLKELEQEVRELRRSNDILRQASAYFAKVEYDRLKREIQRVYDENYSVYGIRKVWRQLQREGFSVADARWLG